MSKSLKLSLLLIAAALVGVIGLSAFRGGPAEQAAAPGPASGAELVREDSHVLSEAPAGSPVLVEFLDFECEGCAAAYPAVEALREEYDGRVSFVLRYFPLPGHANADDSALAVEAAAQQGQLEAMYSRMYETQASWGEQQVSQAPLFRSYAEDLGLDLAAYDAAVADPATTARIQQDVDDGLALGVQGTPTFFLDGERIEPTSLEDFRSRIEAALD